MIFFLFKISIIWKYIDILTIESIYPYVWFIPTYLYRLGVIRNNLIHQSRLYLIDVARTTVIQLSTFVKLMVEISKNSIILFYIKVHWISHLSTSISTYFIIGFGFSSEDQRSCVIDNNKNCIKKSTQ